MLLAESMCCTTALFIDVVFVCFPFVLSAYSSRCNPESLSPNITQPHEKYGCVCTEEPFTLTCKNANLDRIPEDLPPYRYMVFIRNHISTLNTVNYTALERLSLENNSITWIWNGTFRYLEHLERLSLARNDLTVISGDMFRGLGRLEELVCDFNQINRTTNFTFDGAHLRSLRKVSLSHCGISMVEVASFVNLQTLVSLNLSHNILSDIPQLGALNRSLNRLTHLDLSSNSFTTLENSRFQFLPALQFLDLSYNMLQSIGAEYFRGLENSLNVLLLAANNIVDINPGSVNRLQLIELDLHNNFLKIVDEKTINWTNLKKLSVENNRWHCVPNNTFIRRAYIELNVSVICKSPPEWLNHTSIEFLYPEQKSCCRARYIAAIIAVTTTVIIILVIIVILFYPRCRRRCENNSRRQKLPDTLYPDVISYSKMRDSDLEDEIVF